MKEGIENNETKTHNHFCSFEMRNWDSIYPAERVTQSQFLIVIPAREVMKYYSMHLF